MNGKNIKDFKVFCVWKGYNIWNIENVYWTETDTPDVYAPHATIEDAKAYIERRATIKSRKVLPRNDDGQFIGDQVDKIFATCEELASTLFARFPEVDLHDLQGIASLSFAHIGAITMAREASRRKKV